MDKKVGPKPGGMALAPLDIHPLDIYSILVSKSCPVFNVSILIKSPA